MRELTHFLAYFNQMEKLGIDYFTLVDYFSGQKPFDHGKIATWRRNLALTERYLLELWAPVNLRAEGHTILRSLRNEADENKNRYLLQILPDYYGRERVEFNRISGAFALTEAEYRDGFIQTCQNHGLSIYGMPKEDANESGASGEEKSEIERSESDIFDSECENASYADVCEALNVLSALPGNNRQYKLIYALHVFYTIRLHQLLLDQIELSEPIVELRLEELGRSAGDDVPPEINIQVDNHLVRFLADVLYKRKDLCRKPQGFALWQYDLNIADLQKVCGAETSLNYDFFSLVATFCRNIKPVNHSYVSLPIVNEEFKGLTDEHDLFRFNFFYSNLRDIDMLNSVNPKSWREYCRDNHLRQKMVGSFALLLNWDVQYTLLRNLRYHKLNANDILESMRGVYTGEDTLRLLEQISYLTDQPRYKNVFKVYDDYLQAKEFGYGIHHTLLGQTSIILSQIRTNIASARRFINKVLENPSQIETSKQPDTEIDHKQIKVRDLVEQDWISDYIINIHQMIVPLIYLQGGKLTEEKQNIRDFTLAQTEELLDKYIEILDVQEKKSAKHYQTKTDK